MKTRGAFTLIEMLVSALVLAFIVMLAAQMTSGVISTVSHSGHRLDASESVRAAVQTMREELGSAVVSTRSGRFLNLKLTADDESVRLFYAIPRAQTADLARMGFVEHVAYVWDRKERTLARGAYHSSRDPELARGTPSPVPNTARLRALTPAYRGEEPYGWIDLPLWEERLAQAQRTPLLRNVAEWKVECFESATLDDEEPATTWEKADRLPAAMRVTFVVGSETQAAGTRFTHLIALPCAEVQP